MEFYRSTATNGTPMLAISLADGELHLDADKIQQIDIRRDGDQAIVEIAINGAGGPKQFKFATYQAAINFCSALWQLRQSVSAQVNDH